MRHLIESVQAAITAQNWYAGLGLALTIPDICAFLEAPMTGSQKRYVAWCERFFVHKYTALIGSPYQPHVFLSGEDVYALRCAFLHEGADDITRQRARKALDSFRFITPPGRGRVHMVKFNDTLQLQVDIFCIDICDAAETWLEGVATATDIQARLGELLVVHARSLGFQF